MKIKRWYCALLIVGSLSLTACSSGPPPPPPNTGKYAPEINPHPRYFMTAQGNIGKKLRNNLHIDWIATYHSTNPECVYTVNKFEGVDAARQTEIKYSFPATNDGNFKTQIPLDHFLPGFCNWEIESLGYKININNEEIFNIYPQIYFINDASYKFIKQAKDKWICNLKRCQYVNGVTFSEDTQKIYPQADYYYVIEIIEG